MLTDATVYSNNHTMSAKDTHDFVKSAISKFDWRNETGDVIMDIGCGTGDNLRQILLPKFLNVKQVIAIDILPSMIRFAKKKNAHEKIDYYVADIADSSTLERWRGHITKIISIHCLNWVKDQRISFGNIYSLLKPGCEAALTFVLTARYWDTYGNHIVNPKWNRFLKDVDTHVPESHFKKYGSSYYSSLFRDIGFDVVFCKEQARQHTFSSDKECKDTISAVSAFTNHIPTELRDEFKEDFFISCLERDKDGRPVFHYKTLTAHLKKPKD